MTARNSNAEDVLTDIRSSIVEPLKPALGISKSNANAQFKVILKRAEKDCELCLQSNSWRQGWTFTHSLDSSIAKNLRETNNFKWKWTDEAKSNAQVFASKASSPYRVTVNAPKYEGLQYVGKYIVKKSLLASPPTALHRWSAVVTLANRGLKGLIPAEASEEAAAEAIKPLLAVPSGAAMDEALIETALEIIGNTHRREATLATSTVPALADEKSNGIDEMEAEARSVLGWRPWAQYTRLVGERMDLIGLPRRTTSVLGVPRKTVALVVMSLACLVSAATVSGPVAVVIDNGIVKEFVKTTPTKVAIYGVKGATVTVDAGVTTFRKMHPVAQWTIGVIASGFLYDGMKRVGFVFAKQIKRISRLALRRRDDR